MSAAGSPFRQAFEGRILLMDGAMGTMIQARDLSAQDFGGAQFEGCNEHLNLTRPDVIRAIHEAYLDAGADLISPNSFGCAPYVLAEYGLADRCHEITLAGARLARAAADSRSTSARPRFVLGAMGPGTRTISVTGGVTFDQVLDAYYRQARALIEGGVDALMLETCQDTLNVKAAAIGVRRALAEAGQPLPLMVSGTIEPMGTMLAGQGVDALYASLEHLDLFSIGLNCATGPEFMTDHLRSLSEMATCLVTVYPNAGLPDERGHYEETPESLALKMRRFVEEGWVNAVGGCCGTTPAHITALSRVIGDHAPRRPVASRAAAVSGIEALYPADDNQPVLVGERTNVIGSRKFKDLIVEDKFEEGSEVGRAQVKGGAQVLDVCLANPDRDELRDMDRFMAHVTRMVKVPLMIDSTDATVIESALKACQGKAIVNSINLEDGEERFEKIVPLLRAYGGAVVVGCIDENKQQGMAVTRARKLAVAERSHALLTEKYGLPARDLIFDALVFPVGTGDANYIGSAVETIEGIRAIKARFPECKTILGISNVSFGLPPAGREVLNAVFLYHCTKAGLDYAIVNTERLERYPSIPEEERRLAEDLIYWRGAGGARDHQRPPHEGHGRGRTALQRQPAHRGRGAPVRRGHEGGRGLPRAIHGEGRERHAGHPHPGHRQGRRPRHRQEPRGDRAEEQRLSHHQSRHQGPPRGPDRRLSPAQARRLRPVRTARQVRPADGDHGAGSPRRRHRDPALRGRGRADAQVHGDADLRGVRRAHPLCQGRHGRARPRQPALRRHHPRGPHRAAPRRARAAARGCRSCGRTAAHRRGARSLGRLAGRFRPEAARPRSPRAPPRAPDACLSLSQSPDAPRQASGREGLGPAVARRGRSEDPRDQRGDRGAEARDRGAGVAGGQRPLPLLRGSLGGRRSHPVARRARDRALHLPPPAGRRAALSRRLCAGHGGGGAGPRRPLRRHLWQGRARSRGAMEGRGAVSPLPRHPGPRHRAGRGARRDAPHSATHPVGLPRSARAVHGGPAQGALPRHPGLLRLSRLSEPRRPAHPLRSPRAVADRPRVDGRIHDGPRGLRVGPGLPSSRGEVLQGRVACPSRRGSWDCSRPRVWGRCGGSMLAAARDG